MRDRVSNTLNLDRMYTHIVSKDVLEHLSVEELQDVLPKLWAACHDSMLFIVPMTDRHGLYLRREDEDDPTHQIRWQMDEWINFLYDTLDGVSGIHAPTVFGSPHVEGLKPASGQVMWSTGFFKITR